MGHPSVYPTGVTIYNPDKCWSGYTVFPAEDMGCVLIDMSGREVRVWEGLHGFPNKMLPGGYVFGSLGERSGKYGFQDKVDLVQLDYDGNVVWSFDKVEYVEDPGETPRWMARQHHDYQRQGNPVGYYAPGLEPQVFSGNTLVLSHRTVFNKKISDKELVDDLMVEVNWEGEIIWEWLCSEHFDEFDFREGPKNTLARNPNFRGRGMGDWMHINSMSALGPNKWFEQGDARFHPDNIIADGRETNIIFILDKKTGKIVWKLGPDYDRTPEERAIGWIIGQHHAHMIPKGLPGEGNILVFDNGGWAGYDVPNPGAPTGNKAARRDYSRVLEIDPVARKIVWQYTPAEGGLLIPHDASRFYSPFISGMQRLPNGNTMICEGSCGRVFEVTKEHETVWEYINPYKGKLMPLNMVYRAYRLPYSWVPQEPKPEERPVERLDVRKFRVPGAAVFGDRKTSVKVAGSLGYQEVSALCVATVEESNK